MSDKHASVARASSGAPEHRVHGLGREPVRPDWPALTAAEVATVLDQYPGLDPDLASTGRPIWHSPRPFSAAALVEAGGTAIEGGGVFVKRHHRRVRDRQSLSEEHRFIAHLRAHGLPVAEVLTSGSGSTVVIEGDWSYELHRPAPGLDLYREALSWTPFAAPGHARAAGAALARLHLAAADFTAPARAPAALVSSFTIFAGADPIAAMARYASQHPALGKFLATRDWRRDLERLMLPLHARLAPWLGALQPLWGHNDWHASNLFWSGGDADAAVAAILDFGLSDRTSAVFDLATAIERNAIEWLALAEGEPAATHLNQVAALIEGYETERPLSAAEACALVTLLPLVHAEFALSEVGYFDGVLGSRAQADFAYDAYFLGHAAWFGGASGLELLRYLETHRGLNSGRGFDFDSA